MRGDKNLPSIAAQKPRTVSPDPVRAPSKYRAVRTTVDGWEFHSKKEAKRFLELKLLERAGEIKQLELQPRFDIIVNSVKCGFYKADFAYFTKQGRVIEDCKGFRTDIYRLKKKLVQALYNVEILET